MILTESTPIFLYGAGHAGTLVYHYLHRFCKLVAYLDKRADELGHHMGLPIYTIDSEHITEENKNIAVTIVCVKNIFDHENIAIELVKNGYTNLIFCPVDGSSFVYRSDTERKHLAEIYKCIIDNCLELPVEIPSASDFFYLDFFDAAIVKHSGEDLIVRVPSFLAYNRNEGSGIWEDSPMLTLFPHLEIFDWFAGEVNATPDYYINLYCLVSAKEHNLTPSEGWKQNIINSRKMVYEKMHIAEELSPSFFEDHAVPARWNNGGYFNMESGKHRAAFLIHRRKMLIPIHVTTEDYATYLNMPVADELIKFINENEIFELPYPIMHPYFLKVSFSSQNNFFELFWDFARWLSICMFEDTGKINLKESSLLDTTEILYPMLQCFCKLGCKANCLYPVNKFNSLVNRLYHIKTPPSEVADSNSDCDVLLTKYCGHNTVLSSHASYYGFLTKNHEELAEAAEVLHLDLVPLRKYNDYIFAVGKRRLCK